MKGRRKLIGIIWLALVMSLAFTACDSGTPGTSVSPGGDQVAAGESVAVAEGELVPVWPPCGGIIGLACPKGTVCIFEPGTCDWADQMGMCVPVPQACPDVWQPVCGCDGVTYGNKCEAIAAGVSIDHAGECEIPGCEDNLDCPKSQFCEKKGCDDSIGTCTPKPNACPRIWQPVCGCDGKTYANDCARQQAGVPKAHDGKCEAVCGGIAGFQCKTGQVCIFPPGTCNIVDNMGVCKEPPMLCPKNYDPVCGCDGKTYPNECFAIKAGVSIDHKGACLSLTCDDNSDCPKPGTYCRKKPGVCDDGPGVCAAKPTACPKNYDPVCGCDGNTYGNMCMAAAAGVNVATSGACVEACTSNDQCAKGNYCAKKPGNCEGEGVCTPKPQACPDVWMPVCGCDGNTYGNLCEAAAAGVNVASKGECPCEPILCDFDQMGIDYDGDGCDDECVCAYAIDCAPGYVPVDTNGNGCMDACKPAQCKTNADCMSNAMFCLKQGCDGYGICTAKPQICPLYYAPVCGCNGVTYGNVCEAYAAGTNVAYQGECKPAGCTDNSQCKDGYYCAKEVGNCDGKGQCAPKTEVCLDVWIPVCGCDGKTYSNTCYAAAAGINVDYAGECECAPLACDFDQTGIDADGDGCEDTCVCAFAIDCLPGYTPVDTNGNGCADTCKPTGCQSNADCAFATANQFCLKQGCDGYGVCQQKPLVCTAEWAPVCGCDGVTYGNTCAAHAAGVNVAYAGECEPSGCTDNSECANAEYCAKNPGDCGGEGQCAPRPELCIALYAPVCGCDGKTYSNSCVAAAAGVNVAYEGECEPPGCTDNSECSKTDYCAKAAGDCDGTGQCDPRPQACILIYDPVCGCDGNTYGNACQAAAAGVNVEHKGVCMQAGCIDNSQCATNQYCAKAPGECEGEGQCKPRPQVCIALYDPVCGCDGNTYSNSCVAASAGVNVKHDGPCVCADIACTEEQTAIDADGDGCPDTCECAFAIKCASGYLPSDTNGDGCYDFCAPVCQTPCDCYDANIEFKYQCPMLCPTCDEYWACEGGKCVEHCGPMPPEVMQCLVEPGCTTNADCATGQYCAKEPGNCGGQGQCAAKPQACITLYDPVCGCDGKTYSNACVAASAGVNVASKGQCPFQCFTNADCPSSSPTVNNHYCAKPIGQCTAGGQCVAKPTACYLLYDPVCGCDGKTYSNECFAASAGVPVAKKGACQ